MDIFINVKLLLTSKLTRANMSSLKELKWAIGGYLYKNNKKFKNLLVCSYCHSKWNWSFWKIICKNEPWYENIFLSTNSDILLSIIDTCILEVSNNNDLEENKNVCIEMTTKEFFQFYYQIENIKNSLSNV